MLCVIQVKGRNCPPCVWPESCRLKPRLLTVGRRAGAWLAGSRAFAVEMHASSAAFMRSGEEES